MREQQVYPPLAAALPVIPEPHKCDGRDLSRAGAPSPAQGETVTCGMCLTTQGCNQISGRNKSNLREQ